MSQLLEFHTKVGANGRILMPAKCRSALHLVEGDEIVIRVCNEEATLFSLKHAVKRAQGVVAKYTKGKKNLSKQLIAGRRKEAADE